VQRKVLAITLVLVLSISTVSAYVYFTRIANTRPRLLKVVATFYPVYDFATNIGGSKANVSLLVPQTVDVHDFEPTPSSVLLVATADLLIYSGAGLEPWIPEMITAASNLGLVVVDTSKGISLLPVPPAFQRQNRTVDPHIWLDPVLAKKQVENIVQGFIQADPADAQYFASNGAAYKSRLDFLNSQIINATSNVATRNFVTFHEAFAYFAKEYNLTQIPILGPFEEEPTPSDILNVVAAIKQYRLHYVGYESLENPAIVQAIASQTNATLILMDPIEGLTVADSVAGKNYITLMQEDLANIVLALNHVG
jgi:zinc transport system substrate-binding protein